MTIGVGGKSIDGALAALNDMTTDIKPISITEYRERVLNAQQLMREQKVDALFISPSNNLYYFTGINWRASERLAGVIIPAKGPLTYIIPHFELDSFKECIIIRGDFFTWQEHENPVTLTLNLLYNKEFAKINSTSSSLLKMSLALCGALPFTVANQFLEHNEKFNITCADNITNPCRQQKSDTELALIQRAMDMSLAVHQATASILHEGISSQDVNAFINEAHKKVGASGSYFSIVLFGYAAALPHGIQGWQNLKNGDMVLIDIGCKLMGYTSDITRSYVFGEPDQKQRDVWQAEKEAQAAAFLAAQLGNTCEYVDIQARAKLVEHGFCADYALPGLPHRTGHGIGLEVHEGPYLVQGDKTKLTTGMCFSNEPTICIPGEFGVRLEDHFYMTSDGPKWFTQPSKSIDDPFGV